MIYAPFGPTTASPGLVTASMNLSRFPDSEIPRAFRLWGYLVASDPGTWSGISEIKYLREDLRNFLLTYSSSMIAFFISSADASKRGIVPEPSAPAVNATDVPAVVMFGNGPR